MSEISVFKRYRGVRIGPSDPNFKKARWWMKKRMNGRTIHQSLPDANTRKEALAAAVEVIGQRSRRPYTGINTKTKFNQFVESTYRRYVEQNNVNKGAKNLYIRHLIDYFKDQRMVTISAQDCRDFRESLRKHKNRRRKGELSPSSINRIMSTLSKIFTIACEEGIMDRNPMQFVKALPEPPPRRRNLTPDQKVRLMAELETEPLLNRLILLALSLPLRRAQIMAITEETVDFEQEQVTVIASKRRPVRPVPLNATASEVLRAMIKDKQLPYPVKDFRKKWHRVLIAAGINKKGGTREENFHFHDLRSHFASELIKHNTNPLIVQHLFAHSDMSITNIYAQSTQEQMLEAVKKLDPETIPASVEPTTDLEITTDFRFSM